MFTCMLCLYSDVEMSGISVDQTPLEEEIGLQGDNIRVLYEKLEDN